MRKQAATTDVAAALLRTQGLAPAELNLLDEVLARLVAPLAKASVPSGD